MVGPIRSEGAQNMHFTDSQSRRFGRLESFRQLLCVAVPWVPYNLPVHT